MLNSLALLSIANKEIIERIKNLKGRTCPRPGDSNAEIIDHLSNHIVDPLALIFNSIQQTCRLF